MVPRAPAITSALQAAGWKDKEEGGKHMVAKTCVTRMFSVKNYEGAEVLLNMKASVSACHYFTEVGRRCENHGLYYSQHSK